MSNSQPAQGVTQQGALKRFEYGWLGRHWQSVAFVLIFLFGVFLRLYNLTAVPNGLNQDELSAGYESWSLLKYGTDRYGNPFPFYFPSWDSGMNVLYSYLSVPFIAVFGLTTFAVRAVAMVLGLLALPLMYVTARRLYGRGAGLFAMFFLAGLQWHIMIVRWGLEANILPFFLLLGVYTLTCALNPQARAWRRVVALIPLALALYCYGLGLFAVFGTVVLVPVFLWRVMRPHLRQWVWAYVIFVVLSLPFVVFLLENYVFKMAFPFLRGLPFTIPYLTDQRLSQVQNAQGGAPIFDNLALITRGFKDFRLDNSLLEHPIVPGVVLFLSLIAVLALPIRFAVTRVWRCPDAPDMMLLACVPLACVIPWFTQQANSLLMLIVLFAARGAMLLLQLLQRLPRGATWRSIGVAVLSLSVLYATWGAYGEYMSDLYAQPSTVVFRPEAQPLIQQVAKAADGKPIFVSASLNGGYMYVLWDLKIPAAEFQTGHPDFTHHNFANFHFYNFDLSPKQTYYFLVGSNEQVQCDVKPVLLNLSGRYKIGYCPGT